MNKQHGFSLLEILLVLGLVAFSATKSWGSWMGYQHRLQLDSESKRLMHWLINIAAQANRVNSNVVIQLPTPQTHKTILTTEGQFSLAEGIEISDFSQHKSIIFYGKRNMAQPGHITLANPVGNIRIIVSTRGRIRRCDEKGVGLFGLPSC